MSVIQSTFPFDLKDPRSQRGIALEADSGQWLKLRARDGGGKAYGIRSSRRPALYYIATQTSCTCPDGRRRPDLLCKHQLAVRWHCIKAKAGQYDRIFGGAA
jgi:uncharacterized Zn finger protein